MAANTGSQENKESGGEGSTETIQLKVGGPYLRHIVFIHVRVDEEIHKLKLIYSSKVGVPAHFMRFRFRGKIIKDEETPLQLGMADKDFVQVYKI